MSLVDRTNEVITLSLHGPLEWGGFPGDPSGSHPAQLTVDVDFDSSREPADLVYLSLTDQDNDSTPIKLTYDEARLLRDRLMLILGYPSSYELGEKVDD